jgi:hypothetical protein
MISCKYKLLYFRGGKKGLDVINESDDEYSHISGNNLTESVNRSVKVRFILTPGSTN